MKKDWTELQALEAAERKRNAEIEDSADETVLPNVFQCITCRALTFDKEGHLLWHKGVAF